MRHRDLAMGFATLEEALGSYRVPELKTLAGLIVAKPPARHADLVVVIRNAMAGDGLRTLWERLGELERAAVSEALHITEGCFDAQRFLAKYGARPDAPPPDPGAVGRKAGPGLLSLFLFDGLWIPRDLQARLKAFVPTPGPVEVASSVQDPTMGTRVWLNYDPKTMRWKEAREAVPLTRQETARPALHDIHAILRLVETGKVGVSGKTGRVTAGGAKAILEVLQNGDFFPARKIETAADTMRPFAWPLILQAAGLASAAGDRLRLTRTGVKALTTMPHEVIRAAWGRWLETTLLDEFSRIDAIKGQRGGGLRGMTAVADRRGAIVEALAECPAGRWMAVDEFFRVLRASGNDFQVSTNLWNLYVTDPKYGSLGYQGYGKWEFVQGRYAMAFLMEYAATLGLVDIAFIPPKGARGDYYDLWGVDDLEYLSRYDGLQYLRINAVGAWCLGLASEYGPGSPGTRAALRVSSDLEVTCSLPEGPPAADALFLDRIALRGPNAVWLLDRRKALSAAEAGVSPEEMEAFLAARTDSPLAEDVVGFFADLRKGTGALTSLGPAHLIEAADAALARRIADDRRLAPLCRLAGNRHIVVPAASEAAFRRALRELGYIIPPTRRAASRSTKKPAPAEEPAPLLAATRAKGTRQQKHFRADTDRHAAQFHQEDREAAAPRTDGGAPTAQEGDQ